MLMMRLTRLHGVYLLVAVGMLMPQLAFAAIQGTVTMEQISSKAVGVWTLLSADGTTRKSTDTGVNQKHYSFTVSEVGPTVLSVVPPPGAVSTILVYRNGDLTVTETTQQYAFTIYPNDTYRFLVQYAFSKLGALGITSAPTSVSFRMKGPDGKQYVGTTPLTLTNLPVGRYTLQPAIVDGCYKSRPQNVLVKSEQRVVLNFTVTCDSNVEEVVDTSRPNRRHIRDQALERDLLRALRKTVPQSK